MTATRRGGFTLIELVVTLLIVGLLAGAAVPLVELTVKRSKERELRAALREIRTAIDAYKRAGDEGRILKRRSCPAIRRSSPRWSKGFPTAKPREARDLFPAAPAARPDLSGSGRAGRKHLGQEELCEPAGRARGRRRRLRRVFARGGQRAQRHAVQDMVGKRRGFTLIELLVVLAIIGGLVAIAVPRYLHRVDLAKETVLASDLATMREAVRQILRRHRALSRQPGGAGRAPLPAEGSARPDHRARG